MERENIQFFFYKPIICLSEKQLLHKGIYRLRNTFFQNLNYTCVSKNILFCATRMSFVCPIDISKTYFVILQNVSKLYTISAFRKLVQTQMIANMILLKVMHVLERKHCAEDKDGGAAGLIMEHVNGLMLSTRCLQ